MKNILFLCGILALMFFSCDDDTGGTEPPEPPTVKEQVTGNWNITGLEIDGQERTLNSQDKATFKADNTYTMTLPELNFIPTSGSWELTDNDTQLSISKDNVSYTFDINEITDQKMVLQLDYDNFKAEDIIYVLTLGK